ncbi:SRPBCC family protein [Propionibacteriaceae bacterium Y1685]
MARHIRFEDQWLINIPYEVLHARLADLARYPDWWPEVRAIARTGEDSALALIRSRLPYTLVVELTAARQRPGVMETSLQGDLTGWARWTLIEQSTGTLLIFEQEVDVHGAVLRVAAALVRPLLRWNHDQMMRSAVRQLGLSG